MIGASDLEGYASTVVTLAFIEKRVDVIVSSELATPAAAIVGSSRVRRFRCT